MPKVGDSGFFSNVLNRIDWKMGVSGIRGLLLPPKQDITRDAPVTVEVDGKGLTFLRPNNYSHPLTRDVSAFLHFKPDDFNSLSYGVGEVMERLKSSYWLIRSILTDEGFLHSAGRGKMQDAMWQTGKTSVAQVTFNLSEANKYSNTLGDRLISRIYESFKKKWGEASVFISTQRTGFVIVGASENMEQLSAELRAATQQEYLGLELPEGFVLKVSGLFEVVTLEDVIDVLRGIEPAKVVGSEEIKAEVTHLINDILPKLEKGIAQQGDTSLRTKNMRQLFTDGLHDKMRHPEVQALLLLGLEEYRRQLTAKMEFLEKKLGWQGLSKVEKVERAIAASPEGREFYRGYIENWSNYVGGMSHLSGGFEKPAQDPLLNRFLQRIKRVMHELGEFYRVKNSSGRLDGAGKAAEMWHAVLQKNEAEAWKLLDDCKRLAARLYGVAVSESHNSDVLYSSRTYPDSDIMIGDILLTHNDGYYAIAIEGDDMRAMSGAFPGGYDDFLFRAIHSHIKAFFSEKFGERAQVWMRAGDALVAFAPDDPGVRPELLIRELQASIDGAFGAYIFQPEGKIKYYTYNAEKIEVARFAELGLKVIEGFGLNAAPIQKDGTILIPQSDKNGHPIDPLVARQFLIEEGLAAEHAGECLERVKVWNSPDGHFYSPKGPFEEALRLKAFLKGPSITATWSGYDAGYGWPMARLLIDGDGGKVVGMLDHLDVIKGHDPAKGQVALFPYQQNPMYDLVVPRPGELMNGVNISFVRANVANPLYQPVVFNFWENAISADLNVQYKSALTHALAAKFNEVGGRINALAEQFNVEPKWLVRMLVSSRGDMERFNAWMSTSGQAAEIGEKMPEMSRLQTTLWDAIDARGDARKLFKIWLNEHWEDIKVYPESNAVAKNVCLTNGELWKGVMKGATPSVIWAVGLISFLENVADGAHLNVREHPVSRIATIVMGMEIASNLESRIAQALAGEAYTVGFEAMSMSTMRFVANKFRSFATGMGYAHMAAAPTGEILKTFGMNDESMAYRLTTLTAAVAVPTYVHAYFAKLNASLASRDLVHPPFLKMGSMAKGLNVAVLAGMGIDIAGNYAESLFLDDVEKYVIDSQYQSLLEYNGREGILSSAIRGSDASIGGRIAASAGFVAYNLLGNTLSSFTTKEYLYWSDRVGLGNSLNVSGALESRFAPIARSLEEDTMKAYKEFVNSSKEFPNVGEDLDLEAMFVEAWNKTNSRDVAKALKEPLALSEKYGFSLGFKFIDPDSGEINLGKF
ncbi:MAG: hypothetical protein COV46_02605 [Deltaproteobacteria bacterium CG11_big_fil_rev_8_21_14_0_20_49_13]|nr:MAG: hypothetical protein COV46_02605 [Deltaproteobacteria bacterium CG11_big_fil_rev_8_21_14_0_20_49_13]